MFDALRQMTPESVLFRLALAMLFGGMIGMERGRKGRAAGFRTYMLVCLGSALTMLLGQYEYEMLRSSWAAVAEKVGPRIDGLARRSSTASASWARGPSSSPGGRRSRA